MAVIIYAVGFIICWAVVIGHRCDNEPGEDAISCIGMAFIVSLAWPVLIVGVALWKPWKSKTLRKGT